MPIHNRTFDDIFFGKELGRRVYNFIIKQKITILNLSKKIGVGQPQISDLLNGRRSTKNLDQYKAIALGAGMNEKEFNKIVAEAKKAEYEHSTGEKIDTTKELNLDTLDELDFEGIDLLRVLMHRELGKEPTPHDIEMIKMAIKMVKEKEKNNS